MKHMSTWDLLDLAEDFKSLASYAETLERLSSAKDKLASIDAELLSRIPEGEFMTVYDYTHTEGDLAYFVEFLPVGFEPYMGDDNEHLSYKRQAYEQARLDDDLDYGYYQDEMG